MKDDEKIVSEDVVNEEAQEEVVEEVSGEVVEPAQEDLETKLKEAVDKCQRVAAEYYNYRERTSKEKAAMFNSGISSTIEKILPVMDNLERAVSTQKGKEEEETSFYKGVEMTLKSFKEILTSLGVEEIPAVGQKFDHNLHSAVSHIDDENFGENEIVLEMLKGYKLKDKVIRHSMVQVAN